jgi:phage FluMu gp28-like protein
MWTGEQKVNIATAALTEMNPEYHLDFWQDWYLRSSEEFLHVNKSRRIGWSYITSLKGVVEANCPSVDKYELVYSSYGMMDALGKIADARNALMNMPEQWRKPLASDAKTSLEFWDIGKKSKSRLISLPNRTLRGFGTTNPYGGVNLDEFAYHENDDSVLVSALACLSRGGLLSMGSTPADQQGKFYEIGINQDNKYNDFTRLTIPWYWSSALCLDVKIAIKEAPGMTTHERVEKFGTKKIKMMFSIYSLRDFKQEFECIYMSSDESFISMEMIMSCTPQKVEQYEYQNISEFLSGINIPEICIGFSPEGNPMFEDVRAPAYDPEIHGILYAGMDIGRTKDSSVFTILGHKGDKMHQWMSYEMKNKEFDEQREFVSLAMSSLPIKRLMLDKTGLGTEFGEWAEKKFPMRAEGVHFTNEIKETMANKVYLAFERHNYVLPMNRKLHADIHCIRKTLTATKHSRYDGSTKDSHADRFWSLALATLGVDDKSGDKSRFYEGYNKAKGKEEEKKKVNTGNPDLDRLLRQARRRKHG